MSFERNDPADLAALKSEINNDPNAYGYDTENVQAGVLDIINLNRAEITVAKEKISSALVRSTCTYAAYNNLASDEQEWITWMTGSNGFEEENLSVTPDLRTQLVEGNDSIWAVPDKSEMTAAMLALIDFEGSRGQELFGYGTFITLDDWRAARDS